MWKINFCSHWYQCICNITSTWSSHIPANLSGQYCKCVEQASHRNARKRRRKTSNKIRGTIPTGKGKDVQAKPTPLLKYAYTWFMRKLMHLWGLKNSHSVFCCQTMNGNRIVSVYKKTETFRPHFGSNRCVCAARSMPCSTSRSVGQSRQVEITCVHNSPQCFRAKSHTAQTPQTATLLTEQMNRKAIAQKLTHSERAKAEKHNEGRSWNK